jgi:DNA-binding FadR family transcriptional regulator
MEDPDAALALDLKLNRLLGEATGNLMYQLLTNLFTKLVRRLGPLYYNSRRDAERSIRTHVELFAAIEERDSAGAREIIERMLGYSEQAILVQVERLEAEGRIGPSARRAGPGGALP